MIYSSIEFHKKQGWSACVMSEATKVQKRRCRENNTVFEMWEREE